MGWVGECGSICGSICSCGRNIDCPIEHKVYCRLYHICFGGAEEYDEWTELMQGRVKLEDELRGLEERSQRLRIRARAKIKGKGRRRGEAGADYSERVMTERIRERKTMRT